jgi:uncharacterized protein (DUF305 family)
MQKFTLAAALLLAFVVPAAAQQDHSAHGAAPAAKLPAICLANAPAAAAPMAMQHAEGASPAHTELMAGMDAMNNDMMAGGTAADIDVAFVCSMIPHHQGAIDMAKAELKYGDDPWAKEMAQAVITAQEKEIADMLAWLEKQPK